MSLRRWTIVIALFMGLACPAMWAAQEIGDPAPPLSIGGWVKGGPLDLAAGKGKTIYVLEFWATWCGPCRESIPHLTELQHKYKDKGVLMAGISNEPDSAVKPFVDQMGGKMDYVVGVDDRNATARAYLDAYGVQGIPYAFVIDKNGLVAWHGHPDHDMEAVLDRIVAGKFDINAARDTERAGRLLSDYFMLVGKWNMATSADEKRQLAEQAKQIGEKIIKDGAHSPEVLYGFSWNIMLVSGTEYRDFDLAERAAQAAYKATEQKPADRARKLMHDYFRTVQSSTPNQPEAKRKLSELTSAIIKDGGPELLNDFAFTLLAVPSLKQRDLDLALRVAQAATIASKGQDPSILDTYSQALFLAGKRDQAIEYVKKAIDLNKNRAMDTHLHHVLAAYQETTATTRPVAVQ